MEAELTHVEGRTARWWYAVDAARAAVFPPRGSGLPALIAARGVDRGLRGGLRGRGLGDACAAAVRGDLCRPRRSGHRTSGHRLPRRPDRWSCLLALLRRHYPGDKEESFRSGIQTAVWGVSAGTLLTFALWLLGTARRLPWTSGVVYEDGFVPNTMAANLRDAIFWRLIWVPAWGLPFGILGAASGCWKPRTL
jgi:hypothetical protein